jgi:hypothetical protein
MRPNSSATCCSLPQEKGERKRLPTRTSPPMSGLSCPLSGNVSLLPLWRQSDTADAAGGACLFPSAGGAAVAPNRKCGECFGRCQGCPEAVPHTAGAQVRNGMRGRLGIARACRGVVYPGTDALPRRARSGKPPAGGRGRRGRFAERIAPETPPVWGIGAMKGSVPGGNDLLCLCSRSCGLGPPPADRLTRQTLRLFPKGTVLAGMARSILTN